MVRLAIVAGAFGVVLLVVAFYLYRRCNRKTGAMEVLLEEAATSFEESCRADQGDHGAL